MGEGILIYRAVRSRSSEKIHLVLADIKRDGYSRMKPFSVGAVERRMKDYAVRNGITLAAGHLYMSPSAIAHATRDTKQAKGIAVSDRSLIDFPSKRTTMRLLYDNHSHTFVYTDGRNKYIVHPNYKIKVRKGKRVAVNFITASKLTDKKEFNMKKYVEIK